MAGKFAALTRAIAGGLRYAALTAAMREGLPWDGDGRIAPTGLIRGLEIGSGASGGAAGKRPRHR